MASLHVDVIQVLLWRGIVVRSQGNQQKAMPTRNITHKTSPSYCRGRTFDPIIESWWLERLLRTPKVRRFRQWHKFEGGMRHIGPVCLLGDGTW
ncbi:hypothetical protein HYFRA_00013393 [Hymenoscyphus fraxineus]|uniref:Uncharacterized protein n=1 Tax=Hymenoscyphus fraxineus TaxID=746836 RepID=A0A9N9LAB7_9HELO|nr:hypothetical protein HYFRA_00013393 [Hymenoscyphus fraxineus]